ncbi:MAG TPA: HD domain-containing protein [Thermomicrobiales bacterium]|nr:HD domain-containing protein [Thermomicrobiales bacterium]
MLSLAEIAAFAHQRSAGHDTAHDALHLARVVANADGLVTDERAEGAEVDEFVVEAACWLHDVVQVPKGSGPAGEAARQSADIAREFLETHQVGRRRIDAIAHAIEAHSYSGGLRPQTIEAAVVQDADRLDALGAVGIARLWVTGVSLGGTLYHPTDPGGRSRRLDDRAFGLDHIERKLLQLPATMNTAAGRAEATRRAEFVRVYRDEFLRELNAATESNPT